MCQGIQEFIGSTVLPFRGVSAGVNETPELHAHVSMVHISAVSNAPCQNAHVSGHPFIVSICGKDTTGIPKLPRTVLGIPGFSHRTVLRIKVFPVVFLVQNQCSRRHRSYSPEYFATDSHVNVIVPESYRHTSVAAKHRGHIKRRAHTLRSTFRRTNSLKY